jgi:serine/threonine protein kinase
VSAAGGVSGGLVAGGRIADRYELERRIAVGGMGEVWEAVDERLGRNVAVKVLRAELSDDDEFLHRFRIEARTVASLNHSGIAAIHDYGEDEVTADGRRTAYLVMELVRGEPLSAVIARGPMEPAETLRVMEQAAHSLHAAHERGFVHRDVKPGNILIRVDGTVKLTDFGIAKAANAVPVTRTGMVMGTAHYIAPEQASGGEAGPEGDVYSLGIVGYECLAGHRPFRAENAVAVAMMQVRDAPPPLPDSVPWRIRTLIETILVKDPQKRYADGAELAAAIAAVRRDEEPPTPARMLAQGLRLEPGPSGGEPDAGTGGRRRRKERRARTSRSEARTGTPTGAPDERGPSSPGSGAPRSTGPSTGAPAPGGATSGSGRPGTRSPGTPAGSSTPGSGSGRPAASGSQAPDSSPGGSSIGPAAPGSAAGGSPAAGAAPGASPPGAAGPRSGGSGPSPVARRGASPRQDTARPSGPRHGTPGSGTPAPGAPGAGTSGRSRHSAAGGAGGSVNPAGGVTPPPPTTGASATGGGTTPSSRPRPSPAAEDPESGDPDNEATQRTVARPPRPRPEVPPAPPTEPLKLVAKPARTAGGVALLVAFVLLIVAAIVMAVLTVPKLFGALGEGAAGAATSSRPVAAASAFTARPANGAGSVARQEVVLDRPVESGRSDGGTSSADSRYTITEEVR